MGKYHFSSTLAELAVFSILFYMQQTTLDGHGVICSPRQRAAYSDVQCEESVKINVDQNEVVDSCAHCLNGGGVDAIKTRLPRKGWKSYKPIKKVKTTLRAGMCGDRLSSLNHMLGGYCMPYSTVPIVDVWQSGSEVDFQINIHTNHNGYFEFHLCNLDACGTSDIDKKCFKEKHCYRLERVPSDKCEDPSQDTTFECGPIDQKNKHRWYVPCRKGGTNHLVGGRSGTMRYKLPDGVTCKHCILQWYWATANRCNPPKFTRYFTKYNQPFGTSCSGDGSSEGGYNPNLPKCKKDTLPDEYWTCSDVQISSDGSSLGTVFAPSDPPISDGTGKCALYE